MHPKNQMMIKNAFFDWISDYGQSSGRRGGKSYMKRHARRMVRLDGKNYLRNCREED